MSVLVVGHGHRVSFDVVKMMDYIFGILKRMLPKQIV